MKGPMQTPGEEESEEIGHIICIILSIPVCLSFNSSAAEEP